MSKINKTASTHQEREVSQQKPKSKEVIKLSFESMETISGGSNIWLANF